MKLNSIPLGTKTLFEKSRATTTSYGYTLATQQLRVRFSSTSLSFEEVANNFETKLSEISKGTRRGKGTGKGKVKAEENRKGSSKGAFAALDFSYDGRIPFWCKFIQVHDWKNNMQVRQALKEEEKAKETMEQSEG